ncbi:MAG TPA: TolC family protein [Dokdonella sp.]
MPRRAIDRRAAALRPAAAPAPERRRVRRLAAAALIASVAACAHYAPRPLPPERTAAAFAARRLDAPELRDAVRALIPQRAERWPPEVWNRADLLAVALARNPDIAVARAEVDAALAKEAGAAETPNPNLTLQSEYARDEAHPWLYGIATDIVLRTPARRRLDVGIAELATTNARWQLVEKVWSVRRAVTNALADREGARRRGELLDRLGDAQRQLLALAERRVAAGEDAASALVAQRAAVLDVEQQRAQARADAVAAQDALAAALGMPPEALDGLRVEWPDWGVPPTVDAAALDREREHALLSRADLAAAIADYAGSEKQLERAIARQLPEFHLNPGYYWDHGIAKWPFDVGFAPPLFNRNDGEIADARAARELAGRRLLAAQAAIYGAIAAAARAETVTVENADAARRRVAAADEQARHAALGLELGAIDRSERLGIDTVALRAELDALQASAQRQAARGALEDALHAPLSGPELALRAALQDAAPSAASLSAAGETP